MADRDITGDFYIEKIRYHEKIVTLPLSDIRRRLLYIYTVVSNLKNICQTFGPAVLVVVAVQKGICREPAGHLAKESVKKTANAAGHLVRQRPQSCRTFEKVAGHDRRTGRIGYVW